MILKSEIIKADNVAIFKLEGKILSDLEIQSLNDHLLLLLEEHISNIIFDLTKLSHINSTGLNFFIKSLTKCRIKGGELLFFGLNGAVKTVFQISKLDEVFTIYENEEKAIKHFNK